MSGVPGYQLSQHTRFGSISYSVFKGDWRRILNPDLPPVSISPAMLVLQASARAFRSRTRLETLSKLAARKSGLLDLLSESGADPGASRLRPVMAEAPHRRICPRASG